MAKLPMQRPFRFVCQLPEVIADTSHLAADSFGALMRLRMAYWRSGPIRDDNKILARIVGMQQSEWVRTRPELESFFEITNTWTCWITHRDLEESYKAIAKNKSRTEAARLAKLTRRPKLEADKSCDKVSDNACNNSFDNVLIGSIQNTARSTPEIPKSKPSQAKDKLVNSSGDLDALVTAVEMTFSGGDHGL